MKSETCFGQMLDQYIPRNFHESGFHRANEYSNDNQNTNPSAYQLCKYDVLVTSPHSRVRSSKKHDCCTGREGEPKNTYRTSSEAYAEADFICHDRGTDLEVYPCRNGNGWHLTKGD
jgi:hypothetical protein